MKAKLYLDIDDTLFDTENKLREVLGGRFKHEPDIYDSMSGLTDEEAMKVLNLLSDYSKIPMIEGAYEGLKYLKGKYEVTLCSEYMTPSESQAKNKLAKDFGLPIILCGYGSRYNRKIEVNMEGIILVDDYDFNIVNSNCLKGVKFGSGSGKLGIHSYLKDWKDVKSVL